VGRDDQSSTISWTVEWVVCSVSIFVHEIDEDSSISEGFRTCLKQLRSSHNIPSDLQGLLDRDAHVPGGSDASFFEVNEFEFQLQVIGLSTNEEFLSFPPTFTLKHLLENKALLDFPSVHVQKTNFHDSS